MSRETQHTRTATRLIKLRMSLVLERIMADDWKWSLIVLWSQKKLHVAKGLYKERVMGLSMEHHLREEVRRNKKERKEEANLKGGKRHKARIFLFCIPLTLFIRSLTHCLPSPVYRISMVNIMVSLFVLISHSLMLMVLYLTLGGCFT